eukprot:202614_1
MVSSLSSIVIPKKNGSQSPVSGMNGNGIPDLGSPSELSPEPKNSQNSPNSIQKLKKHLAKHSPFGKSKSDENNYYDHYDHLPSPPSARDNKSKQKRSQSELRKDGSVTTTEKDVHLEFAINAMMAKIQTNAKKVSLSPAQSAPMPRSPGSAPMPNASYDSDDELYIDNKTTEVTANKKPRKITWNEKISVNEFCHVQTPTESSNDEMYDTNLSSITPNGGNDEMEMEMKGGITPFQPMTVPPNINKTEPKPQKNDETLFGEMVEIVQRPLPATPPAVTSYRTKSKSSFKDIELSQISENPTLRTQISEYKHEELLIHDTPFLEHQPGSMKVKPLPPSPVSKYEKQRISSLIITNDENENDDEVARFGYGYSDSITPAPRGNK